MLARVQHIMKAQVTFFFLNSYTTKFREAAVSFRLLISEVDRYTVIVRDIASWTTRIEKYQKMKIYVYAVQIP